LWTVRGTDLSRWINRFSPKLVRPWGSVSFGTAGAKAFTFTLTGTTGGGWTLGVDQVSLIPLPGYGLRQR
jgi:hypothetical protein